MHRFRQAPAVECPLGTSLGARLVRALDEKQQQECERKLAEVAAGIALPGERISTVVRMGAVYNEVLHEAGKIGADLIVVGSHRPTTANYLLGSNAATIVRHAPCSVLVVRGTKR